MELESKEKEKREKKMERLEIQKKLESKWEMIRWLTKYTDEHQEQWDQDREQRQDEATGEIVLKVTAEDPVVPTMTEKENGMNGGEKPRERTP